MPAAAADDHQPPSQPRGKSARMRRIRLLQEMENAGLLTYHALMPNALPETYKAGSGFRIEVAGTERILKSAEVEAYVDGMLDALRVLGKLGEDLDRATGEIKSQ